MALTGISGTGKGPTGPRNLTHNTLRHITTQIEAHIRVLKDGQKKIPPLRCSPEGFPGVRPICDWIRAVVTAFGKLALRYLVSTMDSEAPHCLTSRVEFLPWRLWNVSVGLAG